MDVRKQKHVFELYVMGNTAKKSLTDTSRESQLQERETEITTIFEQEFDTSNLGFMLQELRKEKGLTQEQLAEKCGTNRTYISRIENNASDIRLATLVRLVRVGLGENLKFKVGKNS